MMMRLSTFLFLLSFSNCIFCKLNSTAISARYSNNIARPCGFFRGSIGCQFVFFIFFRFFFLKYYFRSMIKAFWPFSYFLFRFAHLSWGLSTVDLHRDTTDFFVPCFVLKSSWQDTYASIVHLMYPLKQLWAFAVDFLGRGIFDAEHNIDARDIEWYHVQGSSGRDFGWDRSHPVDSASHKFPTKFWLESR